jgi:hypothetical protein
MSKTLRHHARQYRNELVDDLVAQLEIIGERAATQLARHLELVMRRTLRFASQFGTVGFRDVEIDIEHRVKADRKGLQIELNVLMIDAKGNAHPVWHIIAFGRAPFRQRRTSPPIRKRNDLRTIPGDLEVTRFPGYSGETFIIPAGTIVKGIPPRRWYDLAPKEFEKRIAGLPTIETLNLKIVSHQIRKPRISFE